MREGEFCMSRLLGFGLGEGLDGLGLGWGPSE